jgi:AcrR family transcriptional regulator
MTATKAALRDKANSELTIKEIARAAGASEAMVQYYFGSKDQLSTEVLRRASHEVCMGLRQLKNDILSLPGNPTAHIFKTVVALSAPHDATTRLQSAEILRLHSGVKDYCQSPKQRDTVEQCLRDIIQLLIDAGIYSRSLDVRYASFVIQALVKSPTINAAILEERGFTKGEFKDGPWLEFCAEMLHGQFVSGGGSV